MKLVICESIERMLDPPKESTPNEESAPIEVNNETDNVENEPVQEKAYALSFVETLNSMNIQVIIRDNTSIIHRSDFCLSAVVPRDGFEVAGDNLSADFGNITKFIKPDNHPVV